MEADGIYISFSMLGSTTVGWFFWTRGKIRLCFSTDAVTCDDRGQAASVFLEAVLPLDPVC